MEILTEMFDLMVIFENEHRPMCEVVETEDWNLSVTNLHSLINLFYFLTRRYHLQI